MKIYIKWRNVKAPTLLDKKKYRIYKILSYFPGLFDYGLMNSEEFHLSN